MGEDVFSDGYISDDKVARLIHTMRGFKHLLTAYCAIDYMAAATSAMREARNGREVVTAIRFDVAATAHVKLVVYDVLGRQVRVLVDGTREAGTHEVRFEAGTLPSGTYLYRLDTPLGSFTGSMLLLK